MQLALHIWGGSASEDSTNCRQKIFGKKIPQSSEKQNLNFQCSGQYLHSIYIFWDTIDWTARRSNQSILKEISPGCSLEGMMLKLKLQYFGHLCKELTHWKRLWCWKGLGAGGEGDDRGWDGWMASPTWWTWVCVNAGGWWWTGRPDVLQFMGLQGVGHDWATELNWLENSIFKRSWLLNTEPRCLFLLFPH